MNQSHLKRMIAPIVIAVLFIVYLAFFLGIFLWLPISWFFKAGLGVIPVCLAGVMIFVVMERMNEIRSGEEDDLSKY